MPLCGHFELLCEGGSWGRPPGLTGTSDRALWHACARARARARTHTKAQLPFLCQSTHSCMRARARARGVRGLHIHAPKHVRACTDAHAPAHRANTRCDNARMNAGGWTRERARACARAHTHSEGRQHMRAHPRVHTRARARACSDARVCTHTHSLSIARPCPLGGRLGRMVRVKRPGSASTLTAVLRDNSGGRWC